MFFFSNSVFKSCMYNDVYTLRFWKELDWSFHNYERSFILVLLGYAIKVSISVLLDLVDFTASQPILYHILAKDYAIKMSIIVCLDLVDFFTTRPGPQFFSILAKGYVIKISIYVYFEPCRFYHITSRPAILYYTLAKGYAIKMSISVYWFYHITTRFAIVAKGYATKVSI